MHLPLAPGMPADTPLITLSPLARPLIRLRNQVRYLKVIEKSGYQALPWVRYITTAGNYEIRMM